MTDAEIGFVERLLDRLVPIDFREEATEPAPTGTDSSWASGWTSAYVRVPAVGQRVRIKNDKITNGMEGDVNFIGMGYKEHAQPRVGMILDRMHGYFAFDASEVEAIGENPRYILVPKEPS